MAIGNGRLPTLAAPVVVLDGVQGRQELRARADPDVVADADGGVVHEQPVVVDEAPGAEGDLRSVAALEPGHDDRLVTASRDQPVQEDAPLLVLVRPRRVEPVEEPPAAEPSFPEIWLVEVPLVAQHACRLFAHDAHRGPRPAHHVCKSTRIRPAPTAAPAPGWRPRSAPPPPPGSPCRARVSSPP
jgi:hypothetical protein